MIERRKTIPPILKEISKQLGTAMDESRKIENSTVAEEVYNSIRELRNSLERAQQRVHKALMIAS